MEGEKLNSYSPGSSITFEVKGDPGAKVSLVAVDNAIFLLSKNRLTQKKVSDDIVFTPESSPEPQASSYLFDSGVGGGGSG